MIALHPLRVLRHECPHFPLPRNEMDSPRGRNLPHAHGDGRRDGSQRDGDETPRSLAGLPARVRWRARPACLCYDRSGARRTRKIRKTSLVVRIFRRCLFRWLCRTGRCSNGGVPPGFIRHVIEKRGERPGFCPQTWRRTRTHDCPKLRPFLMMSPPPKLRHRGGKIPRRLLRRLYSIHLVRRRNRAAIRAWRE